MSVMGFNSTPAASWVSQSCRLASSAVKESEAVPETVEEFETGWGDRANTSGKSGFRENGSALIFGLVCGGLGGWYGWVAGRENSRRELNNRLKKVKESKHEAVKIAATFRTLSEDLQKRVDELEAEAKKRS